MSILNKIKAQINPFDNGATFSNPSPQQPAQGIRSMVGAPLQVSNQGEQRLGPAPVYRMDYGNPVKGQSVYYNHPQDLLPQDPRLGLGQPQMLTEDSMTPAQYLQPQELGNGQQTLNGRYMQQRNYQGAPLSYVDQARQYLMSL